MILVNEEDKDLGSVVADINKKLPHLEMLSKFDSLLNYFGNVGHATSTATATGAYDYEETEVLIRNKTAIIRRKLDDLQRL